jgi:C_GCAxxG_C_C family probable redox protein
LQEKLDLKDPGSFKAASALSGGIGGRGETCGALIGSIMAICLVIGRESLEDKGQFRTSMATANTMYLEFNRVVGHTLCSEIQKIILGRSFKLYEPEGLAAFAAAGGRGPDGCAGVCSKAAGIAAEIIIDLGNR